jgi:hypothetical protein
MCSADPTSARFQYDLRLGPNVVQGRHAGRHVGGRRATGVRPDDAVLYPDVSVPSVEAQQMSMVSA